MSARPYEVIDAADGETVRVIANTPAQAIYYVTKARFQARVLSALEVAKLAPGTVILDATAKSDSGGGV